jgi:hypothetical protein
LDYKTHTSSQMHFGTTVPSGVTFVTFMDCVRVLADDPDQLRFAMLYKPSLLELFASKISGGKIVGGIDDGAELVVDRTYGCDPITGSLGMRTVPAEVTDAHYSRELRSITLPAPALHIVKSLRRVWPSDRVDGGT